MIRASISKVETGAGAEARSILRPVARNFPRLRFGVEHDRKKIVVKAIDDFGGVSSGVYIATRFPRVYLQYREEWREEGKEATLFAIYVQIAVPTAELATVDVVGLHFQPSVDYEPTDPGDKEPSDDQKRWIRGPHIHVVGDSEVEKCHFFLGDDSRRRRSEWGSASVARQMRSHLIMMLDQIHTYVA